MDRYGVRLSRETAGVKGPKNPATQKQIDFCIALGVARPTAETYSRGQAGAVITAQLAKNVKPDWTLLRAGHAETPAPLFAAAPDLSRMPPSDWQMNRLHSLGYSGSHPTSHTSAKNLISELESSRRAGAA